MCSGLWGHQGENASLYVCAKGVMECWKAFCDAVIKSSWGTVEKQVGKKIWNPLSLRCIFTIQKLRNKVHLLACTSLCVLLKLHHVEEKHFDTCFKWKKLVQIKSCHGYIKTQSPLFFSSKLLAKFICKEVKIHPPIIWLHIPLLENSVFLHF